MTPAEFRTLSNRSTLVRIYPAGTDPLWFGPGPGDPPRHRFDSPDGSYGVCYLAHTPAGAFVETFLRDPTIAGGGTRILAASELRKREIVRVELTRSLRVAKVRGPGLSWRGLTAEVSSSSAYERAQKLSASIHSEKTRPSGIEYRCRHDDDELAVALFDRARKALRVDDASALSCLEIALLLQRAYPFVVDPDV